MAQTGSWTVLRRPQLRAATPGHQEGAAGAGLHMKDICLFFFFPTFTVSFLPPLQQIGRFLVNTTAE